MYTYNPWNKFYKEPFGAVCNRESMTIRFTASGNVAVKLIMHRDFGARHEFELERISEDTFETTVRFDHGRALYFYHFEILEASDWGSRRLYYSASPMGGEGHVTEDLNQVADFQLTVFDGNDETPDWYRNSVFYQIFPDRFFNGNLDGRINSPKPNSFLYAQTSDDPYYVKDPSGEIARWDFYGGNLRGIIAKIPYLKELGVNALYLNPIFLSDSNHRYDTVDYLRIDPMLGTEEDFRHLISELHDNDMHIILDGVFSHVGDDSIYFNRFGKFGEHEGAAQNQSSPYYEWFKFSNWPSDYKSWWGFKNMPELDKDNPSFQDFIYGAKDSVLSKWESFNIDGWRLDVADELPDDFIRGIRANLTAENNQKILIGEVWEDASNKVAYGQRRNYALGDALQGVMNYPLRDLIINYVIGNLKACDVAYQLMTLRENYPKSVFYGNLNNIGTHDSERIITVVGEANMDLAIGLMFVMPGVPTIYYGDEAGLTGRKDPENRKYFPWNDIDNRFYTLYHYWAHERLSSEALKNGEFSIGYIDNCLVVLRHTAEETTLFIANPEENALTISPEKITMLRTQEFTSCLSDLDDITIPAKSSCFHKIS
ncbi:MAG: glycoside hydrolase family 13 protein [Streptococcaceae bacterium]|jgi:pullulanase|nr:glycoside hydrolase family 13 protein [Streptococcaceae bacterium]